MVGRTSAVALMGSLEQASTVNMIATTRKLAAPWERSNTKPQLIPTTHQTTALLKPEGLLRVDSASSASRQIPVCRGPAAERQLAECPGQDGLFTHPVGGRSVLV